MKTTLFVAAALVCSASCFAQTANTKSAVDATSTASTSNAQAMTNSQASAATEVKSNAANAAIEKGNKAKKQVITEAKTEKQEISNEAKSTAAAGRTKLSETSQTQLSANASGNAGKQDNKVNGEASLQSGSGVTASTGSSADISAKPIEAAARTGVKKAEKTSVKVKNDAMTTVKVTKAKTENDAREIKTATVSQVNGTANASAKTAVKAKAVVKPAPVAIKTSNSIHATSAIKIH